jgi:hypothetical protein
MDGLNYMPADGTRAAIKALCNERSVIERLSRTKHQMHLAQDNDVVHTLTPDRSDQPFGKAILPRRGWCGGLVPDAHGAQLRVTTLP